ncbi:hypothetical protein K474DRAFT_1676123 [Panus rudis PR-1116 ss-1]|nr:hypothetical protein K474DRAFT_1676123 [Panus rudis PR-1116 ss-1]
MERGSDHGATAGSSTVSTQWEDAVESIAAYVSESLPPVSLEHATSRPTSAQPAAVAQSLDNVHAKLDRLLDMTGRTLALEGQADVLAPDLFDRVADLDDRLIDLLRQEQENFSEIQQMDTKLVHLFAIVANDRRQAKISKILQEAALKFWRDVFGGVDFYKTLLGMVLGMCCLRLLLGLMGEREHTQDWAVLLFPGTVSQTAAAGALKCKLGGGGGRVAHDSESRPAETRLWKPVDWGGTSRRSHLVPAWPLGKGLE